MDEQAVLRRLRREVHFVYIKRKVSVEAARRLEAARAAEKEAGGVRHLRGIHLLPDSIRTYACRRTACHLVGYTQWFAGRGDTGRAGVERALDAALRGTPGRWELRRDGRSRTFGLLGERLEEPVQGYRVVLSVDLAVQQALEEELAAIGEKYRPKASCGVVMDPWTGKILAMASWPDYDPNEPGKCVHSGRLNRTLTTVLEPGSTMKPLVAAAALEEGVFRPEDRIFCENGAWSPRRGRTITDAHGYGWLSFADAVVKSSNIGLAKVGRRMGASRLERYCRALGFGRLTELGMPGESPGKLRPLKQWTRDSVLSIPFGHEISVTPIQLVSAYSAIANGGVLNRPQILERIEDRQGRAVQEFPRAQVGRVFSRKTCDTTREILKGVVERGTGRRARIDGWTVGGKTGTARKLIGGHYSEDHHYASFVGFAPVEFPRAVALISVDDPKGAYYGGTVAAPSVGRLLSRTMTSMDVPRSEPALAGVGRNGGAGRGR